MIYGLSFVSTRIEFLVMGLIRVHLILIILNYINIKIGVKQCRGRVTAC